MVIKGTFTKKAPKATLVIPKTLNPYIDSISALVKKPHRQRATDILYEVANSVAPLMEKYGLKVKMLQEMSPKKAELLGLNVNHGAKILLRLRRHGNDDDFLSMHEIMGTMLHELVHNTIGPHDQRFYKKLTEYEDKKYELDSMGITTILGKGERLGGDHVIDINKARLKKLDKKYQGGVYRLGGDDDNSVKREQKSLQELVREATIRRIEDGKWCHEPEEGDIPSEDDLIEVSSVEFEAVKRSRSEESTDQAKRPKIEVIDLTSD